MNSHVRWTKLSAADGVAAFASRLRRKPRNKSQAHQAGLQEWENEGGSPAAPSEVTETLVTTGSA